MEATEIENISANIKIIASAGLTANEFHSMLNMHNKKLNIMTPTLEDYKNDKKELSSKIEGLILDFATKYDCEVSLFLEWELFKNSNKTLNVKIDTDL